MRIGVTGASGYIGRALLRRFADEQVVVLGRRTVGAREHRRFDLARPIDPAMLDGLDAVVHLAAYTQGDGDTAHEVERARELAGAARSRGLRLVVASSQVAAPDAPSAYGRTKAAIEACVLAQGAVVLRPGLVYGGAPAGLFGLLLGLVRRLPVLPDLRPAPYVQPVHVDDVAAAIVAALRAEVAPELYGVAGGPVSFGDLLQCIATQRLGVRRVMLPVPVAAVRLALGLARPVLGSRMAPERLDSLLRVPAIDARDDLERLGIALRPLETGMARSGRPRAALLREAARLTRATLRIAPPQGLLRGYVRAMERLGESDALPGIGSMSGIAIAARDRPADRRRPGSAAARTSVLLRIAETQPRLAGHFIRRRAGGREVFVEIARAALLCVVLVPLGMLSRRPRRPE
ncbi:SDR family oxidoreductase [Lysobacter humi (ex Lee et al. 2017)]